MSAFIYVTGGIMSDFSSLYLLPIIAASTLRHRRGALQVAGVSAVLYLGIVLSQYTTLETFPHWAVTAESGLPAPRFAQYVLATNLFGFVALGSLAGALAERLRFAGARLVDGVGNHRGPARVQRARHQQPGQRSGHRRRRLPDSDLQSRGVDDHRRARGTGRRPPRRRRCWACRRTSSTGSSTLGRARSQRGDFAVRTEDGRDIELGVTAARLSFPDGRTGYLFTFQDVTDVKRLEREAGVRQRLAAVGEMAAGIAHEIRNPLASMSGSLQVLRAELPLTGDQEQLMDIVLRESDRLNDTIRSFLAYARPQRASITRFDLGAGGERHGAAAAQRRRTCTRITASTSTCPPNRCGSSFDDNQMRQMVWNLATNGLRAMSGGGRLRLCRRALGRSAPSGCASRTRAAASLRPTSTASSSRSAARSSAAPGWGWRRCTASSPTRRARFT